MSETEAVGLLGVLAGVLMAFLFVFLIVGLVLYILHGIGLMGISKKLNVKHGWMAWIPVLNFYLLGKIAFNNVIVQIGLPVLFILSGSYEATINGETVTKGTILPSPLNDIAGLIFAVLMFVCLYVVYKKMSKKAVIMIVFTILSFGLLAPIFLFAIRKNEPNSNNNVPMNQPIPQPVQPMPQPVQPIPQPIDQNIQQPVQPQIQNPTDNNQQNNQL